MYLRYIPNVSLKWLKKSRFHGKMDKIIDDLLLKGKEQLEEIRRKGQDGGI